jgi:hypothetical protein
MKNCLVFTLHLQMLYGVRGLQSRLASSIRRESGVGQNMGTRGRGSRPLDFLVVPSHRPTNVIVGTEAAVDIGERRY